LQFQARFLATDRTHETIVAVVGLGAGSVRGLRSTREGLHQSVPQQFGQRDAERQSVRRVFPRAGAAEAESQIYRRQSDSSSKKQVTDLDAVLTFPRT